MRSFIIITGLILAFGFLTPMLFAKTTTKQNVGPAALAAPVIKTVKPGAAISFAHELAAQPVLNKPILATLNMTHDYFSGELSIEINAPDGISLGATPVDHAFTLSGPGTISLPIRATAVVDGFHVIGIQAAWSDATGRTSRRAYTIPLSVGEPVAQKSTVSASGFVEMAAEETTE